MSKTVTLPVEVIISDDSEDVGSINANCEARETGNARYNGFIPILYPCKYYHYLIDNFVQYVNVSICMKVDMHVCG